MIIKTDSTAISSSACFLRFWRNVIPGWTDKVLSSDIVYGQSCHCFADKITHGVPKFEAMAAAHELFNNTPMFTKSTKTHLNLVHLTKTCLAYVDKYGEHREYDNFQPIRLPDGTPLTEKNFEIPYYSSGDIDIHLCGKIDEIGKFSDGCYAIRDIKSTSIHTKDDYLRSYELSCQLMVYRYAVEWLANRFPESVLGQLRGHTLGAFIEGWFLSSSKDTEFARSNVFFYSEQKMEDFKHGLDNLCSRLCDYIKYSNTHLIENTEPFREGIVTGACETKYGKCKYFNACAAPENCMEQILLNSFVKRTYDPLLI